MVGWKGLQLDREYVDRWSLSLDFEILLRTVEVVFTGRGAE
jgi:lipopolysaccharide/colanic/teichoic acid biosynthesis glycosyltransferase